MSYTQQLGCRTESSGSLSGQASAAAGLLAEAMPTGVVFTTRSAAARAAASSGLPPAQASACSCGAQARQSSRKAVSASGLRPASWMLPKPRSTRPATTARALPPQPSTTARLPLQVVPPRRRGAQKPSTSVLVPCQPPPAMGTRTFTAPSRCARGLSSRVRPATLCLWGMVTLRPRQSMASRPRTTAASSAAGVGRARNTQSSPIACSAAFCITGEREWCTGSPSTPTSAVVPRMLGKPLTLGRVLFGNHT